MKAFTLTELIISMLLSSIIIGVAYLFFVKFNYYVSGLYSTDNQHKEIQKFIFVINHDISGAREIKYDSRLHLKTKNSQVTYTIHDDFIERKDGNKTDDFHIQIDDVVINHYDKKTYPGLIESIEFFLLNSPDKESILVERDLNSSMMFNAYKP